jgi:hypothetical protein
MIVVMTMWLPRFAWRYPGMAAQAAPKIAAPRMPAGTRRKPGRKLRFSTASAAPRPPRVACPSPPMLKRPAW